MGATEHDDVSNSEREDDRALHARLLRRDPTAPADLAQGHLAPLVAWLLDTFPHDDPALLETVAIDLILDLGQRPEQYDPGRSSLASYLRMAARGDRKNALESEHRRRRHHAPLEDVELQAPARNRWWPVPLDPVEAVDDEDGDARVAALRARFHGPEREVVDLILDGERRTEAFAAVLGLHDRPREEQMREVKRAKDRLKKRMKGYWRGMVSDG